jgi:tetratricopeptide (TPR) repeat protein
MNHQERDLTADKIKLIYEFNNFSPLFARVASSEMERDNIVDAIKILESGIEIHPNYPTPYFLLALANAYEGKEDEARAKILKGTELVGSNDTFEYYDKKISDIISERNSLTDAKRPAFIEEKIEVPVEDAIDIYSDETDYKDSDNLEDKLDLLADMLAKAKIIPKPIDEPINSAAEPQIQIKKIFSDTMAEIYSSQKNYDEAISIYKELIKQKPDKTDFYLKKISELSDLT